MNRREMTRGALAASLAAVSATRAQGQEFGRFLENIARDTIRKGLEPETIQRTFAAGQTGEPHPVRTIDGWTLVAHRYKPARPRPGAFPVILCHGLTYNALFWDLDPSVSFARYLSNAGYDVWSISLRGGGLSQKWVWKLDAAPSHLLGEAVRRISQGKLAPTGYATIDPKFANWTMDDHIAKDVPTFVGHVRKTTGAPNVTWVGHSMGGIVAIAMLTRYQNPGIGRLVAIGSQMTMPDGHLVGQYFSTLLTSRQLQLTGQIDAQTAIETGQAGLQDMFFNIRNVDEKVYEALFTWAADVPSVGLMKQYSALSRSGELTDTPGRFNYTRNLANVQIPVLFGCGAADRFAPPNVQKQMHAGVGSTDKSLVFFGRAQGYQADAGHDDALVGLNSRQQVYPVIERWISERA